MAPVIDEINVIERDLEAYNFAIVALNKHINSSHGDKISPSEVKSLINDLRIHLRVFSLEDLPEVFQMKWKEASEFKDPQQKCFVTAHLVRSIERAEEGRPLS